MVTFRPLRFMNTSSPSPFDYRAFEAFFRGSSRAVTMRLEVYLPLLKLLRQVCDGHALDIGCGKGEWLDLLRKISFPAAGIDCNPDFVMHCKDEGLNVDEADLFCFFEDDGKPEYSLITAFHLIEHLSPDRLPWFLGALFSRLMPGGMLILETPNPENVTVGACNFYIDPTHMRPVPPPLLHYMALQSGFVSPIIARLNRETVGEPLRLMAEGEPGAELYNRLLDVVSSRMLQAPDYALIAFKPPAPQSAMLEALATIIRKNDSFVLPPVSADTHQKEEIAVLRERVALMEHALRKIEEKLHLQNVELTSFDCAGSSSAKPVPLEEYPERVKSTFRSLFALRLQATHDSP